MVTTVSGLLITTFPQILGGGYADKDCNQQSYNSTASTVVWSVVYVLGFGPLSLSLVLLEKILSQVKQVNQALRLTR